MHLRGLRREAEVNQLQLSLKTVELAPVHREAERDQQLASAYQQRAPSSSKSVSTCVFTEVFQPFNTLKPYVRRLYYEHILQLNDAIMHVAQFSVCPASVKHCSRVSLRLLARLTSRR